jgi:tetratricopeptide (TPR) repeat protein
MAVGLCLAAGRQQTIVTDRDQYNEGTARLLEGDLTSAEMLLYSTVAGNNEKLQPKALYNLGLTRFGIGAQMLEEAPRSRTVGRQAVNASTQADEAYQEGLTAMQRGEQNALIRAYLRGHGARKQLKEAMKALQQALDQYGDVLSRWQRASGDFHSTVELNGDEDARHNAEVVDRHIANLVDSIQQMQSMMGGMGQQMEDLEGLLEQLGGMIPDDLAPPGGAEGGDEWPMAPEPGMEESPGREGDEIPISPEDAARLLESFNLDRGRPLPMGFEEESNPDEKKEGRNW